MKIDRDLMDFFVDGPKEIKEIKGTKQEIKNMKKKLSIERQDDPNLFRTSSNPLYSKEIIPPRNNQECKTLSHSNY